MNTFTIASRFGTDLSSRAEAASLRDELVSHVDTVGQVTLDFAAVRTVSASFADELFRVLVEERGDEWFKSNVRVENLSNLPRKTVLEAVAARLAH